jgi:hypothetical protein
MNARQARQLANRLEPATRRAFLDAVARLKDVPLRALEAAVASGDVQAIVRLLGVSDAAFLPLQEAIRSAYIEAGVLTVATINQPPGGRLSMAFGTSDANAERYLGQISSGKVVDIATDTRAAIMTTLEAGQQLGQGPRRTALDLAGRMVDGRRQGGIIGLTNRDAQAVANVKAALANPLRVGVTPDGVREFWIGRDGSLKFGVTGIDARSFGMIKRAVEDNKPLLAPDIDNIAQRYHDKLLLQRAQRIARTETLQALNTGSQDALRQIARDQGLRDNQIRRIWRTASDERVRDSHVAMNGESVGLNELFSNGLMYPVDPNGPPEEVIQCRCWAEPSIRWLGNNLP